MEAQPTRTVREKDLGGTSLTHEVRLSLALVFIEKKDKEDNGTQYLRLMLCRTSAFGIKARYVINNQVKVELCGLNLLLLTNSTA